MEGESCVENGVRREEKTENSSSSYNRSGDYPVVNGIMSNGLSRGDKKKEHSSSSSSGKDKHRDREKHKDKDRHRDKEKRDPEHRHSSSSHNKDKDKERTKDSHSSSRDKDRDKDKDRSKESRDKDRDRHRDKEKDGQRDKEKKEHSNSSSSQRDKDKTSSSNSHSKEKHSSSGSSKLHSSSKDKEKHSSSSASSRDKDKHRSSGDKEKDREREKSKHSSSSDKSKHSSSGGSSKDKYKDRDKDKDKEKKYRDKDKKEERTKEALREEKPVVKEEEIKQEPHSFSISNQKDEPSSSEGELRIKEEDDDDMDESSFNLQVDDPYRKSLEIKEEQDSEDDVPLTARKSVKREPPSDEDDVPLIARKKTKKEKDFKRKKKHQSESEGDYSDEEDDYKPAKKKTVKKLSKTTKSPTKTTAQAASQESPMKRKKVKEEDQEVWKWWEEEKKSDGQKWSFLEHKGPVFAPPYERLPDNVKFYYNGKEMKLSEEAEEVATFYGKMLDHDYTTKEAFNKNFFKDWRKTMTSKEREIITDLSKCNFRPMCSYFQQKSEERKAMSKEEKKAIKEKNEDLIKEYGFCTIDGHKEKIGNFRIEPPSLFRGRGEHPKMGLLKKRVMPEDVIINCSKDSKWPKPPPGHKWKEVRHDNSVTWLASWVENVQGQVKYVMLNPSSKLKGEKDWQKYEMARKLAHSIEKIRRDYREDWKSKEMRIRQRAVAMYFIDKLALRAGNEKDEDQADTVGCCSLRVEHIQLYPEKDGKEYVVAFDFLGKDSIRYYNEVPVEKRVFKNVQLFMENKKGSDDLFDRLNTTILNKHLNELMEGLTAKVFRTYNASWTLQQQLEQLTDPSYTLPEMILAYNRANRAVAILCNHQRSIPKSHQKSMENLKEKIQTKKEQIDEAEKQYKTAKKEARHGSAKESIVADKKKKALERLKEQLRKLEVQETDREENKTIALGTSKLNYLDPRISVAWCKKYNVPIDKVYNKTQRDKFRWAIDMAGPDYVF